jgi:hypothetical protein
MIGWGSIGCGVQTSRVPMERVNLVVFSVGETDIDRRRISLGCLGPRLGQTTIVSPGIGIIWHKFQIHIGGERFVQTLNATNS